MQHEFDQKTSFTQYLLRSGTRRLRIWETNYGRDAGWFVEMEGKVIAELTDPHCENQFWCRYQFTPLTDDWELRQKIVTKAFWYQQNSYNLKWRNREFGEYAPRAWVAADPFDAHGRILVRALYLDISHPRWWDKLLLWYRQRQRAAADRPDAP